MYIYVEIADVGVMVTQEDTASQLHCTGDATLKHYYKI